MGLVEATRICLREKYVTFSGRASRAEYLYFMLALILSYFVCGGIFVAIAVAASGGSEDMLVAVGVVYLIFAVALFLPIIAVHIRRLHDRNMSGWWYLGFVLLGMIPVVGIFASIALIVICCLKGTEGENRFGPDPLAESYDAAVFA